MLWYENKEPINAAYLFSRYLQIGFQPEFQQDFGWIGRKFSFLQGYIVSFGMSSGFLVLEDIIQTNRLALLPSTSSNCFLIDLRWSCLNDKNTEECNLDSSSTVYGQHEIHMSWQH